MAHLVVVVLQDADLAPPLLRAWLDAGATGATMIESTGLSLFSRALRDDLPLFPSLRDLEAQTDPHNRTVFSVVGDDATLEAVIAATTKLVGDFDRPDTGVLFHVPVARVLGVPGAA